MQVIALCAHSILVLRIKGKHIFLDPSVQIDAWQEACIPKSIVVDSYFGVVICYLDGEIILQSDPDGFIQVERSSLSFGEVTNQKKKEYL
jgi:hypothetical protein